MKPKKLFIPKYILKVSKFQKQIFLFSFSPNKNIFFMISDQASNMGRIKKIAEYWTF